MPVGIPMYFEDPFITTDVRLLYMRHRIPGGSVLGSGQVHVAAAQIRLALTERLAFIVTKGGHSWVDSHATPEGNGWNDWGLGLKYDLYSNPDDCDAIVTGNRGLAPEETAFPDHLTKVRMGRLRANRPHRALWGACNPAILEGTDPQDRPPAGFLPIDGKEPGGSCIQ